MKNKNRITLLNFLSNLLLRGISIFSAPIFSRLLGTSGFGIVSVYNIWTRVLGVALPMQSSLQYTPTRAGTMKVKKVDIMGIVTSIMVLEQATCLASTPSFATGCAMNLRLSLEVRK